MSAEKPDAAVEAARYLHDHHDMTHDVGLVVEYVLQWSATVAAAVRQVDAKAALSKVHDDYIPGDDPGDGVEQRAYATARQDTEQAVRSALQQNRGG